LGILTAILYILWSFGIFSPVLVPCTNKNLAALVPRAFLSIRRKRDFLLSSFLDVKEAEKMNASFEGIAASRAGLPDFSWYKIPKLEKIPNSYKNDQTATKNTKRR
jgi:hypothetical protein